MNDKFKDSSLIERLRIGSANLKAPWQTNDYSLIDEAVDEINRLERERDEATEDYSRRHTEYMDYRYGGVGLPEGAESIIDRLERERDGLRAALQKAKPIVGAACAAAGATGSNDARRLREKVYAEICEALRSPEDK